MAVRRTGKAIVEAFLARTLAPVAHLSRRSGALILAYHNILPDGHAPVGDRSLHLPQREFAAQLEALARTHDVVPLADAVLRSIANPVAAPGRRPCVAITFDDAYAGAVTAGVAELARLDFPATIFVTPSFLDGGTFWWDTLADAGEGLDQEFRADALVTAHGMNEEVIHLAAERGIAQRDVPGHAHGATQAQLTAALAHPGIMLGSHTWSHPNLDSLADADLDEELGRSLHWLAQFGDRAVSMISYPYGLADERVQSAARKVGYTAGFMIEGGWAGSVTNGLAIPRLNIPAGVSRNGFALRTSGLLSA